MINLRYHIVSLVAVFLALGMGILVGTTVIDRVTVEALSAKLDDVRGSVGAIEGQNRQLADQVKIGRDFADQARDLAVRGVLKDVPVLVMAVAGVDRKPVDVLAHGLATAGAVNQGTLWFTSKMRLAAPGDIAGFAAAVNLSPEIPEVPDSLRALALGRLSEPGPTAALVAGGFATYEPPPASAGGTPSSTTTIPPLSGVPVAGTRFVVVSGAGATVGDDLLALPLAQSLGRGANRVVAVESGQDSPGGRAVFIGPLRSDPRAGASLSTVDNLESPMGQVATVLALEQLAAAQVGHFGVGPGSQRLLPPVSPAGH
ncbi:MAG: copper transporter [Acidimicrobiales bacterium]